MADGVAARKFSAKAAAFAAATLLTSCAVGPDFLHPAAPEVTRYTKEPLAPRTSSTDAATGLSQHFAQGRDIPQEWWTLFKSPALNALIKQSLNNNPDLQSAIATLRASKEAVYAQQGNFFPFVQANFNPTRNQTSASLAPIPSVGANIFNLYTAQVAVSYTFDVWGLNRRTVESLKAMADDQRFQVEAAYLTLTSNVAVAAINEASLRGQIDATNQLITINTKMLDILRKQFDDGYANRNDVALQEAALAQVKATLPPLRKALQQNRDLISALAGVYPSQGAARNLQTRPSAFADRPAGEPAVAADRATPGRARGGGAAALGQRTDRRRHRQHASELHDQRQWRIHEYGARRIACAAERVLDRSPATPRRRSSTAARCCTTCAGPRTPIMRRPGVIGVP